MFEEINKLLEAKEWALARASIEDILDDKEDMGDEAFHTLIYDLIVCDIELKDYPSAQKALTHNAKALTDEEATKFNEIIEKEMPTRIKKGEIMSLGFFDSATRFTDVIGLGQVKKYLQKSIIYQIKHPEVYKKLGAELKAGAIFYGPPGTGKTLLARAVAGEVGGRMLIVRLPDIINKFAGDSEKNIKKVFEEAKRKKPSIVFIDEIDGIGQKRENADNDVGQGALAHNVITTLLSELDGITKDMEGIYTIGTTNRPWALDEALTRSGRISDRIYIPLPKFKDRKALFQYYLKSMPIK